MSTTQNGTDYYTGYEDDAPAGDFPLRVAGTEQSAEYTEDDYGDSAALARRLLIAFLVIAAVWILFVTVLATHIPPILPAAMSLVIMVGALMASPDAPKLTKPKSELDDARPVGCCQGPRPLGEASRKSSGADSGSSCGCN